jgi:hypothetical protein
MLDYGAAPFGHFDWPDHIVPVSRGGKDVLDNLVGASFSYNSKKLNNGRDKNYLFREGRPTDEFFWTHGEVSGEQAALLKRNARLTEALAIWRRLSGPGGASSFARRGLVRYPTAPDVRLMLSLAAADDRQILNAYGKLVVHYRGNCKTMERFCRARNAAERRAVLSKASDKVTEPLINVLRRNFTRLKGLD